MVRSIAYEAKYSDFLEMKAQREEMEMASERKETEYSSYGGRVGKTWLPGKKYESREPVWTVWRP